MKLARMGKAGHERPVIVTQDRIVDISAVVHDIGPAALSPDALDRLRRLDLKTLPTRRAERFGPCVAQVGKIICVGLNYVDHATESGFAPPVEPIIFMKATSALSGADDPICKPARTHKIDYEVELGVIIGSRTDNVPRSAAMRAVAGYCVFNDVSERAFQLEHGGQWVKGKSLDSFAPCGPWLVTADEVDDPQRLDLQLWVNGDLRQSASARDMIFPVDFLISYVSQFMTLMPGDIVATGTPPGVALGMAAPTYLAVGDVVELEIAGLGRQRQIVRAV